MKLTLMTLSLILAHSIANALSASTPYPQSCHTPSGHLVNIEFFDDGMANVTLDGVLFEGTYQQTEGQCPSRLCGSDQLRLHASLEGAAYGEIGQLVIQQTSISGSHSSFIDLYDVGGRAPASEKLICGQP